MSPGAADPAVIRRHLLALDAAVRTLRTHRGRSIESLRGGREMQWIVEHGLQICAQNALDIATHVAASAGRDVPDYGSAVDRLAELGVLPADFALGFRSIAGLRNVLVHGYLEIDLELLHRILEERLEDFEVFARHVDRWLSDRPSEP